MDFRWRGNDHWMEEPSHKLTLSALPVKILGTRAGNLMSKFLARTVAGEPISNSDLRIDSLAYTN